VASTRVLELLERIGNLLRRQRRREAARRDLQPVHLDVLDYLARCNRYSDTAAALGEYLGVTKGTLSQTLALLTRRGLLKRRPDALDARVVRLAPTAKGLRLRDEILDAGEAQRSLSRAVGSVSALRETALAAALHVLQRADDNPSFGACRSCRHLEREAKGHLRCAVTGESLRAAEAELLCRMHSPS
jgi:DNA-binding MarR family transcriptional regulator